jgi:hypothetical protein
LKLGGIVFEIMLIAISISYLLQIVENWTFGDLRWLEFAMVRFWNFQIVGIVNVEIANHLFPLVNFL